MTNDLRRFIPFFDPSASQWAAEARWLRWLTFLWLELGDGLYYFKRQLIAVAIGLAGFNLMVYSPLRYLMKTAQLGILVLLGVLWLTLIPGVGTTVNGATRWISLGPVPIIQPSELIKPFFVLQSARIFGNWPRLTNKVRFTWLLIFGAMLLGILLQPNLSTTALCGMTLWLVALAAGLPYLQLGATAMGGMLLAVLSISFKEYQRRRIMSFLNPWADAMQDGYQLVQSLLAVGSGGILFYLPIQYSDFIFAVFAEEFGLVGGFSLLLMLAAYATVALRVAMRARNAESQLVAIGVMVVMVGQSLLNIGVATGVLPTTGLPLPFFSYGGSSMVASLLLSGLLIRVARESSEAEVVSLDGRRGQHKPSNLSSYFR
ncbi:MAG: FtsW/RodA/SpoVE family cell cycle protein [Oscillatoriales cyanobacterium]|nr:MAG: FtsW/RodA/SpoVE family cell cycle protein [Oscillatoriales cyanobacterium]